MTPEALHRDWLSLRCWLTRCVLPSTVVLIAILALLSFTRTSVRELDHNALLVTFFTVYFILIRGGHILMIRSLHRELMRKYETEYRESLSFFTPISMKRRNVGFTLARLKREFVDKKNPQLKPFKR